MYISFNALLPLSVERLSNICGVSNSKLIAQARTCVTFTKRKHDGIQIRPQSAHLYEAQLPALRINLSPDVDEYFIF